MNAGILPLFLSLLRSRNKEVVVRTLHMLVLLIEMCEQSPNGQLWKSLGISRLNSHVLMDDVSRFCTEEVIDETMVRFLFEEMVGSQQIEENGRNDHRD